MNKSFESIYCNGNIKMLNDYDIVIEGTITDKLTSPYISYVAPAPCDTLTSFSGSGLPYPTKQQAFYNTPNIGKIKLEGNKFVIKLLRPNSYYLDFNILKKPHLQIVYNTNSKMNIDLSSEAIAYRSLQYPELRTKTNVQFYNRKLPIRSQEKILRDSGYDDRKEHPKFWGLKPPC